jgi:DNA-binding transcriptional ArsR family regulator
VAADVDEIVVAPVFRALADPTRRQILQALRKGELAAGDIASRFPISGPSVSRHLAVLKAAGLVTERREANRVMYSLVAERLALCVGSFLSAVCPEELLGRHQGKKKDKAPDKAKAPGTAPAKSGEKPSGKDKHRRGQDKPVSSKLGSDKLASNKPGSVKPASDKPASDKLGSDKLGSDSSDNLGSDKRSQEKAPGPAPALADATADELNATV